MSGLWRWAQAHWRICGWLLLLMAAVLLPFGLWGDTLERSAPGWLRSGPGLAWIAFAGATLLVLDVLLPIPSSVLSMVVCLALGPLAGALVVFTGMSGAFVAGYVLGQMMPQARLRRWLGADDWDSIAARLASNGWLWLAGTRPIPVLAEVTAVMAGSMRLPFARAFMQALTSCALVSAAYAAASVVGLAAAKSSVAWMVMVSAVLPAATWFVYRRVSARGAHP